MKEKNNNELLSKLSLNDFNCLDLKEGNLIYSLKKFILKNEKDRIFIGEIKNKVNLDNIKELEIIKRETLYIKDYEKSIKDYCENLNLKLLDKIEKINSYRFIIGLGNPNVTETAITLHHTYGIPYVPGQTLKGALRNYFLGLFYNIKTKEFIHNKDNNLKITYEDLYKYIFGDNINGNDNEKGAVIFFDAFPVGLITIEKDVITPHYGSYYKNGQNPVDEFNPNPISFYTIRDTKFDFFVAINKIKLNLGDSESEELEKFIIKLLQSMLEEHGLGAKTSVGYGRFDYENREVSQEMLEKLKNRFE